MSDASASCDQHDHGGTGMQIRKRDGSYQPVDVTKIVRSVERCSQRLNRVDPLRVATRTIAGLHDGATTAELDALSIRIAAGLVSEEPQYSKLAARLLSTVIAKETEANGAVTFSESVAVGFSVGLIAERTADFVARNARLLDGAVNAARDDKFEFFGLRTVYDRYLLRHPHRRTVFETPQHFLMRVACGLSRTVDEAVAFYELISSLRYLPSSPTLFNSGTVHPQMSSCYLLDSPTDSLEGIYDRYADIAKLSKFAGGIGVAWHRVRSRGSLIRGTNGESNGIVPWLKTLDSSVAAVNQGGRRKGAACVYLESWHADIEEFLELRDNTGDHARRTHNLNLANWIPDEFMRRVENDWQWSLFDPKEVPHLCDLHGADFDDAYREAEAAGLYARQVSARDLYSRMMRTLAQTGNGWMTFKDAANAKSNQTGEPGNVIHLSNLCTEIVEVTSDAETAVCNLGSVNLAEFVEDGDVRFDLLERVAATVVLYLDRVVDINFYPIPQAAHSNQRWRPVGLGMMGLQDVFFAAGLPFDSPEARALSTRIAETVYFAALSASCELAEQHGPHPAYSETRAAAGLLQHDLWDVEPPPDGIGPQRWDLLRARIAEHGLRNSLLIAIAPTATIASIAGCGECVEPQVSNLFKRETLSGEFVQINRHLVSELQARGLWDETMAASIRAAEGSVQHLDGIPDDLKAVYRTAWELPQRALIDMAAARGPFVDQSQSLNLFMETPSIGKLSSMYMHAWKAGLKTTYYLRSRPATRINPTTVSRSTAGTGPPPGGVTAAGDGLLADTATSVAEPEAPVAAEAAACSLENPETCEVCQ